MTWNHRPYVATDDDTGDVWCIECGTNVERQSYEGQQIWVHCNDD